MLLYNLLLSGEKEFCFDNSNPTNSTNDDVDNNNKEIH